MQSKHYLKISRWVLKMIRWMSSLLALMNTVSDLVCEGSPVSPPSCTEMVLWGRCSCTIFLMALHHYMYWRNQQQEWTLAETAGSNICMSEWPSHLSQMVLLCHSSPQLFYLPGSTRMAQLWCKYQMSLLQWAPSARISCWWCPLVVGSERAAVNSGLWGCTGCAAVHLPK